MTPTLERVHAARKRIRGVALHTPLTYNANLSTAYGADISLKREDLQPVRSYKLRGAYNKIASLTREDVRNGVVCASAGNHAQGVAFACSRLGIRAVIFMPVTTPQQKVRQVERFGQDNVEVVLKGDTFDAAYAEASAYCTAHHAVFIHPFDDAEVVCGQGTVALELLEDATAPLDLLFVPIGGGGLAAGICTVFKQLSPHTRIIGVEPAGAASMWTSIRNGANTMLDHIDKFVDGAAVRRVGDLNFALCKEHLHEVVRVPEGQVCTTILKLYNEEAIVVEPAGALAIAALEQYREQVRGQRVACIVSGSNNDIVRMAEIRERSLLHEGLKHYFIVNFPQRPGALKQFVNTVLGPEDDITYFQFSQKNNRESGPAVVGIELHHPHARAAIETRLDQLAFSYQYLNENPELFGQLVG